MIGLGSDKNGIGLVFMLILVLTQVLSLNEFLELIVPICYMFCYLVAFYGPNALLIGWKVVHSLTRISRQISKATPETATGTILG